MKNTLKSLLKYSVLLSYGGMLYVCIELLFRGRSDISMMFCGGLSFVFIGLINNIIPWEMPLWIQSIIGGFLVVTPLEYIFGLLFNQDFTVWDYRMQPFNINGQVCLLFSLLWCVISIAAIILDDYLRYWLFDEEKPHYKIV